MPKPIVYLANNCGFSETNKLALQPIEQVLSELGFEIWEPFKRANEVATADIFDPMLIADKNAEDILNCDLAEFKRHCYKSVRELQDVNKYLIQFVAEFHEKQTKLASVTSLPSHGGLFSEARSDKVEDKLEHSSLALS